MNLDELLNQTIDINMIDMTISNPRNKDGVTKVKIRPVIIAGNVLYQTTEYIGTQVFHKNSTQEEVKEKIIFYLNNNFKQAHLETKELRADILVSKKGMVTIKVKQNKNVQIVNNTLSHNRNKRYILEEGKPVDFLIDLGVMTREGKIVNARYDKFRQINRFLEFIEDILPKLDKNEEQTIIDMEHTPKNLLIRAVYTGKVADTKDKTDRIKKEYNMDLTLDKLIKEMKGE